jgi:uncharacterized membrane protein
MRTAALAFIVLISTLVVSPAHANFEICNETKFPIGAALGYHDGKLWRASGWWIVHPKSCTTLINAPLIARYYYVYAVHMGPGGRWDGNNFFCIHETDSFSIPYGSPCTDPKLVSAGFFEVDTGNSPDYIQRLQD